MIDAPRGSRLVLLLSATLLALAPAALAQRTAFDVRREGTAGTPLRVGGLLSSPQGTNSRAKRHAVAVDASGNVYVVGQSVAGDPDMVVVAYDRHGVERWRRTRGGTANNTDSADAVALDSAGNVYVAGYVFNTGNNFDAVLIKYSPDGTLQWEESVNSSLNGSTFPDDFSDIVVNGNWIYCVGTVQHEVNGGHSAMFVFAVDTTDNQSTKWSRLVYDDLHPIWGRAIALDTSGNLYVAGVMQSSTLPTGGLAQNDFITASFTSAGGVRWSAPQDAPVPVGWNTPYAIAVGGDRVYVVGSTVTSSSTSEENYYTVAYDTLGNPQWQRDITSGTPAGHAWSVVADTSGNAYVTGGMSHVTDTSSTAGGCYTVSYAPDGTKRWDAATGTSGQVCYAAAIDSSSNVYLVGNTDYGTRPGMLLESYTSSGQLRWRKAARSSQDEPDALAVAVDSSYVYVAGSRSGTSDPQFVTVAAANSSGNEVWTARSRGATTYAVADGKPGHARHAVATDAAGNTYVVGRTWNGTNYDMYIVSYGPAGGPPRWEASKNGPAGLNDWAYAVTVAAGGYVIVTGVTESTDRSLDYLTVCYSTAGGPPVWSQTLNGTGNSDDYSLAVVADSSGHAFVTGWSWTTSMNIDFLTVAYDTATGAALWTTPAVTDGAAHSHDQAVDMTLDSSGSVYVTGTSYSGSGIVDILTVKYNPATGAEMERAVRTSPDWSGPAAILSAGNAVYVTGATGPSGTRSCLTIKYDLTLNEVWQDLVDSQSTGDAAGTALAFDSANNILYVAGYGTNAAANRDFLAIRYAGAALPGEPTFTDYGGSADSAYGVAVDQNGMAFLTGVSDNGIELRIMTAAFQPTGTRLWTHVLGTGSWTDGQGFAVAALPGRGAVVAGTLNDSYDCIHTIAYTFSTPTITAGTALSRSAGGTPQLADPLVNIHDDDTATSSLVVTAINVPPDLTVGPITVNGTYNKATATVGAACSATAAAKTIVMQVRSSGYVTATANVTVNVTANTAPVLGTYNNSWSTRTGEPRDVTANAAPTDNGTVTLNATASAGFTGTLTVNSTTGKVTITNPGPGNGAVYTITVTGTDNCGLAATPQTFYLTVTGPAPVANARATAVSTSAVHLTWDPTAGALSYDVWRRSLPGSYAFIENVPAGTTAYDNTGLTAATTYLYYVTARASGGVSTYQSNIDVATTILFTDDPVQAGTTVVKALHFDELRTAVNAVRAAAGLTAFTFTPSTVAGATIASAHMTDLRTALNQALTSLVPPGLVPAYPATAGTPIRAADVTEIRNAVK